MCPRDPNETVAPPLTENHPNAAPPLSGTTTTVAPTTTTARVIPQPIVGSVAKVGVEASSVVIESQRQVDVPAHQLPATGTDTIPLIIVASLCLLVGSIFGLVWWKLG